MYDENLEWFSQKLFRCKDSEFNTNVSMNISFSSSTSDYINFSPPLIGIQLLNNTTKNMKNASLSYYHLYDLVEGVNETMKNENLFESNLVLVKNVIKNRYIKITFTQTPSKINVVVFGIFYTDTDYTYIVLHDVMFRSVMSIFNNYISNYISITNSVGLRQIQSKNILELNNIKNAIHSLPSSINNSHPQLTKSNVSIDIEKYKIIDGVDDSLHKEFDEFIGGNEMVNIPVEKIIEETGGLLKDKENVNEISSDIFIKILDSDIANIEPIIDAISIVENPIKGFEDFIIEKLELDSRLTPSINDIEFKTASYLSKLVYTTHLQQYLIKSESITSEILPMLYEESNRNEKTLNIVYDLFLIMSYIKLLKDKLVNFTNDNYDNKSVLYLSLRCFTDIILFSNLVNVDDNEIIITNISSRFEYFRSKGMFDSYDNILSESDLPEITKFDVINFSKLVLKAIKGFQKIEEIGRYYFEVGSSKIEASNNFSLEQILNEIVPLEVHESLYNKAFDSEETINKLLDIECSKEVVDLFLIKKEIEVRIKKEKPKGPSNIYRYINHYNKQIPENVREEFLKYVEDNLNDISFNFKSTKFKLEQFGKEIIIALNVWDPENNKLIKNSYKDFYLRIENSCLDVNLFLSGIATDESKVEIEDWGINV